MINRYNIHSYDQKEINTRIGKVKIINKQGRWCAEHEGKPIDVPEEVDMFCAWLRSITNEKWVCVWKCVACRHVKEEVSAVFCVKHAKKVQVFPYQNPVCEYFEWHDRYEGFVSEKEKSRVKNHLKNRKG